MLLSELQIKALKDLTLDIEKNWETFPAETQKKYRSELGHLMYANQLVEELMKTIERKLAQ